ncbi:MAG: hypothetical protein HQ508_05300 [Candidatus Marinimicrobia bacterium]|nr:hypothetical protein [Candidatus Neomarinimicrobiota bacterium]
MEPNISSDIIPRWEWRNFNSDYESMEKYFTGYDPAQIQTSDEIYFLMNNHEINIKLRHQLIDIKKRLSVSSNGLEQWAPFLKLDFPVSKANMKVFFNTVERDFTESVSGADVSGFVTGISKLDEFDVVHISKYRYKYYVIGVSAELTKIRMNQLEFATISLEHENADLINQAKIELGINTNSNENYPAALKRYRSLI